MQIDDAEAEARIRNGKLILTGPDGKVRYTLSPSERNRKIDAGPYRIRVEGADGLTTGPLKGLTDFVAGIARGMVGDERVVLGEPTMPADDFAYVLERVPGCYFKIGTANEARGLTFSNHHPRFDIDEAALPLGVELFVRVVERYRAEVEAKPPAAEDLLHVGDHAPDKALAARDLAAWTSATRVILNLHEFITRN